MCVVRNKKIIALLFVKLTECLFLLRRLVLRVATRKVTVVSIGHRSTLFKLHEVELNLDGAGNYKLRELSV